VTAEWKVSGDYFEACNCEAACPCVFLSPPTDGDCSVLIAWHIAKGHYADVQLDDLSAVLFAHTDGHMARVPWKVALYLDERAEPQQCDALAKIFSGNAGGHLANLLPHIGEVMGMKNAKIEFERDGRRRRLRIVGVADMAIEALNGQGGAEVTVRNHPLTPVAGEPAVVARSSRLNFHDHGFDVQLSDRNGFYSPFSYTGA
jgi:hypothetical protein